MHCVLNYYCFTWCIFKWHFSGRKEEKRKDRIWRHERKQKKKKREKEINKET